MPDWHKLVGKDVHLYMVGAVELKKGHCSVHYQQACPRLMTGNARPPASYLQHFLRLFQSDQNTSELMYTDVRFIHLHTTHGHNLYSVLAVAKCARNPKSNQAVTYVVLKFDSA